MVVALCSLLSLAAHVESEERRAAKVFKTTALKHLWRVVFSQVNFLPSIIICSHTYMYVDFAMYCGIYAHRYRLCGCVIYSEMATAHSNLQCVQLLWKHSVISSWRIFSSNIFLLRQVVEVSAVYMCLSLLNLMLAPSIPVNRSFPLLVSLCLILPCKRLEH